MRVSTNQLYSSNLAGLSRQNSEIAKLQTELATGTKIHSASDNPAAATKLVELNRTIERNEQYNTNGDFAYNRLDQSETVLDAVDTALSRINGLITSGLGKDTSTRAQLANQLQDELDIMVDLANVRDGNGDYLYAGLTTDTEPFDDSGTNVAYTGNDGQRSIQIADGRRVTDGNSGQEVFENTGAGRSVFAIVESVISELSNPLATPVSIQTAVTTATPDLAIAKDNITLVRNSIASRMGMISTEQEINAQITDTLIDQRSNINDVDLAEAAVKLNQLQTTLQAAQQTFVKTQELSLFNYI